LFCFNNVYINIAFGKSNELSNITRVSHEGKCGPVEESAVQAALVNFGEVIGRFLGQNDSGQSQEDANLRTHTVVIEEQM